MGVGGSFGVLMGGRPGPPRPPSSAHTHAQTRARLPISVMDDYNGVAPQHLLTHKQGPVCVCVCVEEGGAGAKEVERGGLHRHPAGPTKGAGGGGEALHPCAAR